MRTLIQWPPKGFFGAWLFSNEQHWIDGFNSSTLIKISYLENYYEEIKQIEDFGIQDFISNVGGFIGIFVGYSMIQIPELLGMWRN